MFFNFGTDTAGASGQQPVNNGLQTNTNFQFPKQNQANNVIGQNAVSPMAQQRQDFANDWFNNTDIGQSYNNIKAQKNNLKKEAKDNFMQNTWIGNQISDYQQGIQKGMENYMQRETDKQKQQQQIAEKDAGGIIDSILSIFGSE